MRETSEVGFKSVEHTYKEGITELQMYRDLELERLLRERSASRKALPYR